jgi:hypothetical protein
MIARQSIHMTQFTLSQSGPVLNIYTNIVSWFLFGEDLVFMVQDTNFLYRTRQETLHLLGIG